MKIVFRTAAIGFLLCLAGLVGMNAATAAPLPSTAAPTAHTVQASESDPLTITNNLPYAVNLEAPSQQHRRIEAGQTITIRTAFLNRGIIGFTAADTGHVLLNADIFVYQGQWKTITVYYSTVHAHIREGKDADIVLG